MTDDVKKVPEVTEPAATNASQANGAAAETPLVPGADKPSGLPEGELAQIGRAHV